MKKFGIKIRDPTRSIPNNSYDYDGKYMKIQLNSDDDLALNKMLKLYNMVIVVRLVFHKAKKYYPKVLLVYSMFIQIS